MVQLKNIKHILKRWAARYLPSEIAGFFAIIAFGNLFMHLSGNIIISSYAASIADWVVYYGLIFFRDVTKSKEKNKYKKTFLDMTVEFGPAEIVDTLVTRPFFLSIFTMMIANYSLGLMVGSLVANILFYSIIITIVELKSRKTNSRSDTKTSTKKD
jgi:hypothetical protein